MVNFSSSTNWLWGLFTVGVLIVARPAIADETKPSDSKKVDPFEAAAKQSASDEAKASVSKEVDPFEAARSAFKETSNQAMSAFVDSTVAIDQPYDQVLVGSMRKELDDTKAELAKTKQLIGEVIHEFQRSSATPDLPPLADAQVRIFQIKNTSADDAADKIKLLIGTQPVRIAVDEASNGLIVFGKAEALTQVEQLVIKLDDLAVAGRNGFSAPPAKAGAHKEPAAPRRTLMLRVFWLADGVEGFDNPDDYLPFPAVQSLGKLGITHPRLVTQTVTSISVEENAEAVQFSTQVPAVLFEQPMRMILNGDLSATADNRSLVDMHLTIENGGSVCEMSGSLAAPIGHFMVLGTANSVIPEQPDGMPMGGRFGGEMGGGGGTLGGMPPAKYNASRFAFVVQVIEAESFEPEGNGQ